MVRKEEIESSLQNGPSGFIDHLGLSGKLGIKRLFTLLMLYRDTGQFDLFLNDLCYIICDTIEENSHSESWFCFKLRWKFPKCNNSLEQRQQVTMVVTQNQHKHSNAALTGHFIKLNFQLLVNLNS